MSSAVQLGEFPKHNRALVLLEEYGKRGSIIAGVQQRTHVLHNILSGNQDNELRGLFPLLTEKNK